MARPVRRDYSEVRRLSAHRRAGHHWWKWYVIYEPMLTRLGPPVGAVVGLWLLWWKVPHLYLGIGTGVLGAVLALAWMMYQASNTALQKRMSGVRPGTGLGWAVWGLVVTLAVATWAAIWSPLA